MEKAFSRQLRVNLDDIGPWWLSNVKRARLLLDQSEFESQWLYSFILKMLFEKNEINEKDAHF